MIEIVVTCESITQAKELLVAGADTVVFGEETFGLRLPASFSREEQGQLTELIHAAGKKAVVAVNGIMHPEKMKLIPDYLRFLKEIAVDQILVGDPGIVQVMKQPDLAIPFIYGAETLVTNARQINFWGKRGAIGAVLAREVPFDEMKVMANDLNIPVEVQVYGATCIHQSKRPLLENYYHYTQQTEAVTKERGLFLSDPQDEQTHYSIYEDDHGTHIFATNDLSLMKELGDLAASDFTTWKLDGLFTPGADFVAICQLFAQAKSAIEAETWNAELAEELSAAVATHHPKERGLDTGFYYIDPKKIK